MMSPPMKSLTAGKMKRPEFLPTASPTLRAAVVRYRLTTGT